MSLHPGIITRLPRSFRKVVLIGRNCRFNKDEVLNHAIEFVGSEETMASLSVDARLTIANMTTEWGALRYGKFLRL